jgi:hypothetical protein
MQCLKTIRPVAGNSNNTANIADTVNSANYGGTVNQNTGNTLMRTIA